MLPINKKSSPFIQQNKKLNTCGLILKNEWNWISYLALEIPSECLNRANLLSWMDCLLGPICLFSLFIPPFLLTDVQRRNCAVQLSYMHPQQLSLLSSKLIKQMPPYPTFYKEQHVIDSSLGRRGGRERDFILTLSSWYFFFPLCV